MKDYPGLSGSVINTIAGVLIRERPRELTHRGGEGLPQYYYKGRWRLGDLNARQGMR